MAGKTGEKNALNLQVLGRFGSHLHPTHGDTDCRGPELQGHMLGEPQSSTPGIDPWVTLIRVPNRMRQRESKFTLMIQKGGFHVVNLHGQLN